ncbi:hypothetical protein ACU4GG_26555 [Streptomyces nojiriensis]
MEPTPGASGPGAPGTSPPGTGPAGAGAPGTGPGPKPWARSDIGAAGVGGWGAKPAPGTAGFGGIGACPGAGAAIGPGSGAPGSEAPVGRVGSCGAGPGAMAPADRVGSGAGPGPGAGAWAGGGVGVLRGANQLLDGASASPAGSGSAWIRVGWGFGRCSRRGCAWAGAAGRAGRDPCSGLCGTSGPSSAEPESALIGLRTTTGGIGREPGMLIRIRVVSVVSVLGPSGSGVDGFEVTGFSSGDWPVPYGGVPEG